MTTPFDRVTPDDPRYPAALRELAPAPDLWVRGTLLAADALAIAIVGARRVTSRRAA
jgi:predicted Rossmann fold nucleotide-binding protein DprA/Smf involved in DNA uptake